MKGYISNKKTEEIKTIKKKKKTHTPSLIVSDSNLFIEAFTMMRTLFIIVLKFQR